MKRVFRLLFLLIFLLVAGFAVFVNTLPSPQDNSAVTTPALVVFTGGSKRIDAAFTVIQQGYEGVVLISGVHPDVTPAELYKNRQFSPPAHAQITFDYQARSTRENLKSTIEWLQAQRINEVTVITSHYHAARVALLFRLFAPEIDFNLHVVQPNVLPFSFLVREYLKLLVAPLLP